MQSSSLGRYHQDQGDKPIRVYLKAVVVTGLTVDTLFYLHKSLAVAPPYSRAVCCTVLVIVEYHYIAVRG
jgi:hypothetical protein